MDNQHWTDFLLMPQGMVPEYILETEDMEWHCKCGNNSRSEGFQPSDEIGQICEPYVDGNWNEQHWVCERCYRIIDGYTLQILGKCSTDVINKNTDFMFG